METLKKYVSGVLGFEVDGYVLVDLDAFIQIVDLVGGVYFDVPQSMYYNDPTQNLYINLAPGYQLLDGKQAMGLVRYRSYAQADIQRISVQQEFLQALAKQCLQIGNGGQNSGICRDPFGVAGDRSLDRQYGLFWPGAIEM